MFAKWNNYPDYECGWAAIPHLWIAGGLVAVGMGIAFWDASWGRFLGISALVLVLTGLINAAGLMASGQLAGCDNGVACADWKPD